MWVHFVILSKGSGWPQIIVIISCVGICRSPAVRHLDGLNAHIIDRVTGCCIYLIFMLNLSYN